MDHIFNKTQKITSRRISVIQRRFAKRKTEASTNELANVKSLFVQPAMGDMGIPLGSLLYELSKEKGFQKKYQNTMSL